MFFRANADTDYYRSSRPITDILNRYVWCNNDIYVKIKNNKGSYKNFLEMLLNYFISESFLKIADTIKIINIGADNRATPNNYKRLLLRK